ncbi:LAMI_0C01904g1_1 [Lachancea mirantina]|uniref:LAMI_0C01904g1_1 n=1 Tax=Lachancea mirantina TaxID=1230905 RepID=A0A1G4J0I6_9SACH|nr:LAMI_0C01904g1_1 [Lachancea mirantina]
MATESERRPLSVISNSRMNKLSGVSPVKDRKLTLPSITSIMNVEQEQGAETVVPDAAGTTTAADATVSAVAPVIVCEDDPYSLAAHKLRVRLQLAYYKYKTNQSHLKFRQLQRHEPRAGAARRLVVSQGAFRTPVKSVNPSRCLKPSSTTKKLAPAKSTPRSTSLPGSLQDTPISVKAAKQLLQLFSSAN